MKTIVLILAAWLLLSSSATVLNTIRARRVNSDLCSLSTVLTDANQARLKIITPANDPTYKEDVQRLNLTIAHLPKC